MVDVNILHIWSALANHEKIEARVFSCAVSAYENNGEIDTRRAVAVLQIVWPGVDLGAVPSEMRGRTADKNNNRNRQADFTRLMQLIRGMSSPPAATTTVPHDSGQQLSSDPAHSAEGSSRGEHAMITWRMAFRAGKRGPSLWPECRDLGVAAIQYDPLNDIDLSPGEAAIPKAVWSRLAPSQQRSVKRIAYEMRLGDVIYVKDGPCIVGRGVVAGPYRFVSAGTVAEPSGVPWQHQRSVTWESGVPEVTIQVGSSQQYVVQGLSRDDVARLERELVAAGWRGAFSSPDELPPGSPVVEGAAVRVWVNAFERDPRARRLCIAEHGTSCGACGMSFGAEYGPAADGYIHVHHLRPLSEVRAAHPVDPVADLRPVCPNCHAVIHRRTPPYSIEEVRAMWQQRHAEPGAAPDPAA